MAHDRPDSTANETGGEDLSRIYSEVSGAEPPAALDALILKAAREEIESKPAGSASAPSGSPRFHQAPWAMAALVVLAAMLYQVIPGQQMGTSEPIVVSMADHEASDFAALQNKLKEARAPAPAPALVPAPAAPAAEKPSGIGAVSKSEDFRQSRIAAAPKQVEELPAREVDELAPKPAVVAIAMAPSAPTDPARPAAEPLPAEKTTSIPLVAMADQDLQEAHAASLEQRSAGKLVEYKKRAAAAAMAETEQAYRAPDVGRSESRMAGSGMRKDDIAESAMLAGATAVAEDRAQFSDQVAGRPNQAAAGQVLIFAGAIENGIFLEKAGDFDGLAVVLIRRVLAKAGYQVEFRAMSLGEAVEQARSGAIDGVIGIAASIGADSALDLGTESFSPDGQVFAFSPVRSMQALRMHVDAELARMRATGELTELQSRYAVR